MTDQQWMIRGFALSLTLAFLVGVIVECCA